MAWYFFVHSLKMLIRNLPTAVRILLPLICVDTLGLLIFGANYLALFDLDFQGHELLELRLFVEVLWLGAASWVGISWCRFVYLQELPSVFPQFHGRLILSYFTKSVLIIIMSFVAALPVIVLTMLLSLYTEVAEEIMLFLILVPVFWVSYRLSVIYVSVALEEQTTFRSAWRKTRAISSAILGGTGVLSCLYVVEDMLFENLFVVSGLPGAAIDTLLNWVLSMIGLSLMATIYGATLDKDG